MHYNISVLLHWKNNEYVMNEFKRCIKPFGTISIEKYEYDIWMDLKDAL